MSKAGAISLQRYFDNLPTEEALKNIDTVIVNEEWDRDLNNTRDFTIGAVTAAFTLIGSYFFCLAHPFVFSYMFYPSLFAIYWAAAQGLSFYNDRSREQNMRIYSLGVLKNALEGRRSLFSGTSIGESFALVAEEAKTIDDSSTESPAKNKRFVTTSDYLQSLQLTAPSEDAIKLQAKRMGIFFEMEPQLKAILESSSYQSLGLRQQRFCVVQIHELVTSELQKRLPEEEEEPKVDARGVPSKTILSGTDEVENAITREEITLILLKLSKLACEVALPLIGVISMTYAYFYAPILFTFLGMNALTTGYFTWKVHDSLSGMIKEQESLLTTLRLYLACSQEGYLPALDKGNLSTGELLKFFTNLQEVTFEDCSTSKKGQFFQVDETDYLPLDDEEDEDLLATALENQLNPSGNTTNGKATDQSSDIFSMPMSIYRSLAGRPKGGHFKGLHLSNAFLKYYNINDIIDFINDPKSTYSPSQKQFLLIKLAELLYATETEETKDEENLLKDLEDRYRKYQAQIQQVLEQQAFFTAASSLAKALLVKEATPDTFSFTSSFTSKISYDEPLKIAKSDESPLAKLESIRNRLCNNEDEKSDGQNQQSLKAPLEQAKLDQAMLVHAMLDFRDILVELANSPKTECTITYKINNEDFSSKERIHLLILGAQEIKEIYGVLLNATLTLSEQEDKNRCQERLAFLIKEHARSLADAVDVRGAKKRLDDLCSDSLFILSKAGERQGQRSFKLHQFLQKELNQFSFSSSVSPHVDSRLQCLEWDETRSCFIGSDEELSQLMKTISSSGNIKTPLVKLFTEGTTEGNSARCTLSLKRGKEKYSSLVMDLSSWYSADPASRFESMKNLFSNFQPSMNQQYTSLK